MIGDYFLHKSPSFKIVVENFDLIQLILVVREYLNLYFTWHVNTTGISMIQSLSDELFRYFTLLLPKQLSCK